MVQVVWKYAHMDKFVVVWKYAQMHQNTFLTTPDVKKKPFKVLILVVWKCIIARFLPLQTLKYNFLGHDFGSLEMHKKRRF